MSTAKILPQNTPAIGRAIRWELKTSKPHNFGKNCEYVKAVKTTACSPNTRSLKRTVGSSETGCLAAYWLRMTGE